MFSRCDICHPACIPGAGRHPRLLFELCELCVFWFVCMWGCRALPPIKCSDLKTLINTKDVKTMHLCQLSGHSFLPLWLYVTHPFVMILIKSPKTALLHSLCLWFPPHMRASLGLIFILNISYWTALYTKGCIIHKLWMKLNNLYKSQGPDP